MLYYNHKEKRKGDKKMKNLLIIIMACAISFGTMAGLVFLATWAFGWQFTWKMALGVWVIVLIIRVLTYKRKS